MCLEIHTVISLIVNYCFIVNYELNSNNDTDKNDCLVIKPVQYIYILFKTTSVLIATATTLTNC